MESTVSATSSFQTQFRAALNERGSGHEPALGDHEGSVTTVTPTAVTSAAAEEPYNAGYDTGRGWIAAGGVALAVIVVVLLFALAVAGRHHDRE